MQRGLRRLGGDGLQAALVAIDPQTGNLLALVGGSDYQLTPFNRAVRARRQPGSAFKPFVYAAAIDQGLSPMSTLSGLRDVLVRAPGGFWSPRSAGGRNEDTMTLRDALVESNNAAAVLLQRQIGSAPILRLASNLGVGDQPDVPSLALGSGLVTPLDLTAAYAVFPAFGERVRPRGLVSIENAAGERVHMVHIEQSRVLSPETAFQMVTILQDVVARGTGAPARRLGVQGDVGGKTGTTTDGVDAWFVGFNSAVVAGVWVGFDKPRSIGDSGSGAQAELPIWAEFMRLTAHRLPSTPMMPPAGVRAVTLCRLSHQRAGDDCPGTQNSSRMGTMCRPSFVRSINNRTRPRPNGPSRRRCSAPSAADSSASFGRGRTDADLSRDLMRAEVRAGGQRHPIPARLLRVQPVVLPPAR